jgi:GNAT superfamily N-acetyltransferase
VQDQIIYRELRKSDYKPVAEMIRQTWEFDKAGSPETAALAGNMYLRVSLAEQTFVRIAEKNGIPVGVVMGRINGRPICAYCHNIALFWIMARFRLSAEGRNIRKIFNNFFSINEHFLEERKRNYDGELVLFIVSQNEKGKGVGKELLSRFYEYMRETSARTFYLFTDSYCDYGFYDQKGFRRVCELSTDLALHPNRKMDFFMYESEV